MTLLLAAVALAVLVFAVPVALEARRLSSRSRRVSSFRPPVPGNAVPHASAPARLVTTRLVLGAAGRRLAVAVPALPVAEGELRVTDAGLAFSSGPSGALLEHGRIVGLSLLPEAEGAVADRSRTLLAVELDVDGGPLEVVFSVEGTRVTAERVRREAHVRGERVKSALSELLARRAGGSP